MTFWTELKRRKLFQVTAAYAVIGWLLIQVAALVFPELRLPAWTVTFVTILVIFCFPLALFLAWAFELTPTGVQRTTASEQARDRRHSRPPLIGYGITAVVASFLGVAVYWVLDSDSDAEWLVNEALPRIEESLAVADWDAAYTIVREVERRVPENPELEDLWTRVSWTVSLQSEPAGARVFRRAFAREDREWESLGSTPLEDIRFPFGLSEIRLELDGYETMHRTIGGAHTNWERLNTGALLADGLLVGPELYRLDPVGSVPEDMVRVNGWRFAGDGRILELNDYYLGRYEVTNREYKAFVDAGGYQRESLWDPIVVDGEPIPWATAVQRFVDRTGRPGPSTWSAGDYPDGADDMPVSGISWYEAAAYARYAGRELPSSHHWQHALATSTFPWLLPLGNFSGEPRPVTESRAMSYTGTFDMAGNVREWTANRIGDQRIILGGNWNDPYYVAGATDAAARPEDRSEGNGLRLAITSDPPEIRALMAAPLPPRAPLDSVDSDPVSADIYTAYSRVFDYDRAPLNAQIEEEKTTRVWQRERVSFDAAYGNERVILYLYLPTNSVAPYQTIVYWSGWDTFRLNDVDHYFARQIDFIVRSGRAVAFPVLKGTFERRSGDQRQRPPSDTIAWRDNAIDTVKDIRRTIDYLATRSDIDASSLAYFGYSWGGLNGPLALAQEPRFVTAIIDIGVLEPMPSTPEVDPINSLPRIDVPTLMFSGEFDSIAPLRDAEHYFDLIGVGSEDKRHVIVPGGHFIPRDVLIRETLDWLDQQLGPVGS